MGNTKGTVHQKATPQLTGGDFLWSVGNRLPGSKLNQQELQLKPCRSFSAPPSGAGKTACVGLPTPQDSAALQHLVLLAEHRAQTPHSSSVLIPSLLLHVLVPILGSQDFKELSWMFFSQKSFAADDLKSFSQGTCGCTQAHRSSAGLVPGQQKGRAGGIQLLWPRGARRFELSGCGTEGPEHPRSLFFME